jgi:predicted 3-demethylubiquinone-9 3-methyltransferase (glyoxalase superfamily)
MKEKITPCLWFDGQAKEAADLYCAAFANAKITSHSPIVTAIEVSGQSLTLLDGGPMYKPNPSISFRYACTNKEELDRIWKAFTKEGKMLADNWVIDKFGVGWQLVISNGGQKITPNLIYNGRAKEAKAFYSGILKPKELETFIVSDDGSHNFKFTEGVSLTIHCENQEEIDYYWTKLTESGGQESMCGWLKDKFGVSWQIIPVILSKIMSDPTKAGKAAKAFMSMRKLNIEQIVQASIS